MECRMEKDQSSCPCIKLYNPTGFVYVVKDIDQKYIDYLSEIEILEQPSTTRITEKLFNAFPNFCSKSINKKLFFLLSDTISTLDKDYIESPDEFFIALRKMPKIIDYKWLQRSVMLLKYMPRKTSYIQVFKNNQFSNNYAQIPGMLLKSWNYNTNRNNM